MTRLVIFDCDGTLVDSQNGICAAMELAFQACSLPPPTRAETLSIVGLSLSEAMAVLAPTLDGRGNRRLVEAFREATIEVRAKGHEDTLYAGAAQAIADLAGRDTVLLGVATGKSRRGVARLVERDGWQAQFPTNQTADGNPPQQHHPHQATSADVVDRHGRDGGGAARDHNDWRYQLRYHHGSGCGRTRHRRELGLSSASEPRASRRTRDCSRFR